MDSKFMAVYYNRLPLAIPKIGLEAPDGHRLRCSACPYSLFSFFLTGVVSSSVVWIDRNWGTERKKERRTGNSAVCQLPGW